jgi:hypothetical protein
LPDTFTDYKGVTKYWNPIVNAPKNVEVPKKMKDQGSDQRGGVVVKRSQIKFFSRIGLYPEIKTPGQPLC